MLDLIGCYLVRLLNFVFHNLPISWDLWMGRRLGWMFHVFGGKRTHVMYANLKAAFGKEKTPSELKAIARGSYENMAQIFAEIVTMTKLNQKYVDKYIEVENLKTVAEAAKNPNGLLFLTAHLDNWELLAASSFFIGFPLHVLSREQKMKRLNELLCRIREAKGNVVIRKGKDIKNIFRVLKKGKIVGIVGDQNAGMTGEFIDLFGRKASTASGPYRFAQKCGASILPVFIYRVKGPYHKIIVEEPMSIKEGEDIRPYMVKYHKLLEKYIREHPEQWLWMHKKWKVTPYRKVMVLSDGKKGHLKQALAAVEEYKRFRLNKGFSPEDTEAEIVDIRFKNKSARVLFNAMSPFFSPGCQGCLKCLKWALDEASYKKAVMNYADAIVSCGSSLTAVNKLLKIENSAKNLTVFDPGFLNRKRFNLIILPKHDITAKPCLKGLAAKKNVIVTDLAPNLITPGRLQDFGDNVKNSPTGKNAVNVGVLIGGDNAVFCFNEALVKELTEGIKKFCGKTGGSIYLTTSRRTSRNIEDLLYKELADYPKCAKFVRGRDDKDEYTVEKIFERSDVLVVSAESISMVSEAVSSGRPVLVFLPGKKKDKTSKYEIFVKGLEEEGFIKLIEPGNVCRELASITEKKSHAAPCDREKIYAKIEKLL
ncbi:MAG: ELM1/GtrOC1 family putative glycosyltransferase [Candidatus Omnitrophica bacterium]|nr:ELM1/GtrOC1 family putative glycosyltransferase [Candidatus Omnitrophota bacterium]